MNVIKIQEELKNKGFYPALIDGVNGRKTIAAIKMFQAANGLEADGIVGPKTAAKLFGNAPPSEEDFHIPSNMPWLQEAYDLRGTDEIIGRGSNQTIIAWARSLNIAYADDEIPWCGLFVAHCIGSQLTEEHLPSNPLGARSWEKFGIEVKPQLGAVMVFWRKSKESGLGHVGFYWAEDGEAYQILGGNQSNSVTLTRVAKARLVVARWPSTAPKPTKIVTRTASKDGLLLSHNEA